MVRKMHPNTLITSISFIFGNLWKAVKVLLQKKTNYMGSVAGSVIHLSYIRRIEFEDGLRIEIQSEVINGLQSNCTIPKVEDQPLSRGRQTSNFLSSVQSVVLIV